MALSYYGIHVSQAELGNALRPYQVVNGDNDDKSVTMDELADKAKEYGLIPYHRPNGDIALIKQFINLGIPVITRTWLHVNEDIGHYRIVKGYDDTTQEIIQDDSFENKNLRYSYTDFLSMWSKYSDEYLVLLPADKQQVAEAILGENLDTTTAWTHALVQAKAVANTHPDDMYAIFNVSVAAYYAGNYQLSVNEYEKIADQLPFRTLWYQIEPIQAYYELGQYDKVFAITERVLINQNRAFSELYLIRGNIYKKQGKLGEAKAEYEQAVQYNSNLKAAKDALASLSS
jgi:tetratricopeptide (TPR) repeat protein